MPACDPTNRLAGNPDYKCNEKTGRWVAIKPQEKVEMLEKKIADLQNALKASSKAYDVLARKNANNVIRYGILRMLYRKRSKKAQQIPAIETLSSLAASPITPNRTVTAGQMRLLSSGKSDGSVASFLNEVIFDSISSKSRSTTSSPRQSGSPALSIGNLSQLSMTSDLQYRNDKLLYNDAIIRFTGISPKDRMAIDPQTR